MHVFLYAGGPKRKKVLRTTYNDKGEEVTEMVYEDEPTAEPAITATEPQARMLQSLLYNQQ